MHLVFTVARETGRMQKEERDQGIPVAVIEQTGKWNLRLRERTWDRSQLISKDVRRILLPAQNVNLSSIA